jgi:glucuronate isomerase
MSAFIHGDVLLGTKTARTLYHEFAAGLPIIDYHCHLDPRDLAGDRRFENLAQLWVTSDPYKHRVMRLAGVPEQAITGNASDREKFDRWAATVPRTIGNPLYSWTALELKRYFGLDEPLAPDTAQRIWAACNGRLAEPGFTARGLLAQRGVECVCTSDRLLDDLAPHAAASSAGGGLRVLPSLRSDDIVAVASTEFLPWLQALAATTGIAVADLDSFRAAVALRLDAFARAGCRLADHALDDFCYVTTHESEAAALFARRLRGETLGDRELVALCSALLRWLALEYARRNWVLQLHLGAQRNTSTRLRRLAGPAGGYATIGRATDVPSLCAWFDELEQAGGLPRTILYPLDPADFVPLATLTGSFAEDGVAGKLQLGPAWWFNDHEAGMRAQLDALANHSLLANFIGMTTDSRSLLSMVRHEYFRRVLCDWLGAQAERGAFPAEVATLGALVHALCYENARRMLTGPITL